MSEQNEQVREWVNARLNKWQAELNEVIETFRERVQDGEVAYAIRWCGEEAMQAETILNQSFGHDKVLALFDKESDVQEGIAKLTDWKDRLLFNAMRGAYSEERGSIMSFTMKDALTVARKYDDIVREVGYMTKEKDNG